MAGSRTLKIEILGSAKGAQGAFAAVEKSAGGFGSRLSNILSGAVSVAAGLGIAKAFSSLKSNMTGAINAASDMNESLTKNQVLFGDSSQIIEQFASTTAMSFGISKNAALEATGTFGNLFRAMNIGQAPAADMSTKLVGLAGDLASFNNADPSDVLEAIRSGLVGETEPLRKFGVNLNQAALADEAVRLGLIKTTKEALSPAAKAQAAYALIMEQTTLAQGDFSRTSSGMANSTRIIKAEFADIQARIGQALLPLVASLVSWFAQSLPRAMDIASGVFNRISAVLSGPLHTAFVMVRDGILTFAQALSGNWTDSSKVEGVHRVIGNLALIIRNQVIPAVQQLAQWFTGVALPAIRQFATQAQQFIMGQVVPAIQQFAQMTVQFIQGQIIPAFFQIRDAVMPILERIIGFVRDNWQSVLAGAAAILLGVVVPAFVAWAIAAGTAAVATIAAALPVIAILAAIGIAVGALYLAWSSNFLNIQGIVSGLWAAIQPIIQAIIDNLTQFGQETLPKLKAAWDTIKDGIIIAVQAIHDYIFPIFEAIAGFIQDHADTIKGILQGVWDVISGIIQTAVDIIEGIIKTALDIISGNWSGAWDDIKGMVSQVWDDIQQIIHGFIDIIKGEVQLVIDAVKDLWKPAWDAIKQVVSDAWDGIKSAISGAKDGVVGAVQGVIDGIKGKFSDAGTWLKDAGKKILQGLIDGIDSMISSVKDKLSKVTDLIPSWKGPLEKDRMLSVRVRSSDHAGAHQRHHQPAGRARWGPWGGQPADIARDHTSIRDCRRLREGATCR